MNIKENWKKYGKHILTGGIAIIKKVVPVKENANKVTSIKDLPKPEWTDICHISEYWKQGAGINMIVDVKAGNLSEFAKRYTSEIEKDSEKIISFIISTTE